MFYRWLYFYCVAYSVGNEIIIETVKQLSQVINFAFGEPIVFVSQKIPTTRNKDVRNSTELPSYCSVMF